MIEVTNLSRRFGAIQALAGVSFHVRPGEVFGLLGPNGAGKTTAIHIVAGIDRPDEGTVVVAGCDLRRDARAVRARVGLVPQEPGFYGSLTARENLAFWAAMYGVSGRRAREAAGHLLEVVGLAGRADEPVSRFSGGMRRRLNLALGLVHRPPVVLLDEPTLEVDPQSRRQIVDFIKGLAREGAAILYTTHQLGDAQEVCDRIAILDRGRIVAEGTLAELRRLLPHASTLRLEFACEIDADLGRRLQALPGAGSVSVAGGVAVIQIADLTALLPAMVDVLHMPGVVGMRLEEPNLETVFLHLTGRGMRD